MKNAPKILSLSCNWRYGRLNAINALVCATLIAACLTILLSFSLPASKQVVYNIFIMLVGVIYHARVTILRLHDMNLSGKLAIPVVALGLVQLSLPLIFLTRASVVIGVLGIMANIALLAIPGTKGINRFGEEPEQGNIAGLVAMIILILSLVALSIYGLHINQ